MNASELRIGNAVYCKYRQGYFLVKEIAETWLRITDPKKRYIYSESYETVLPIELTAEILHACGFKYQDRDTNQKEPRRFYISPFFGDHREYWLDMNLPDTSDDKHYCWLNWDIGGGNHHIHLPEGAKLQYFHQLQNLWHSLTAGTELTINLEKVKV